MKTTTGTMLAILFLTFVVPLYAQGGAYQPGDRVQCDLTRIGKWEAGTVLSVHAESYGTYYKVKIDGDAYESWNCHPEYMRAAPAAVATSGGGSPASSPPSPPTPPAPVAAVPSIPKTPAPAAGGAVAVGLGASAPAAGGGGLRVGEYACYGSGGSVLIGLGFKVVAPGRTTDLDGGNPGSYSVQGSNVVFRGGHLDGQVGRDLNDQGQFVIGTMASCEPW